MHKTVQAPAAVVMVRPHHFCSNPQTMLDNTYQTSCQDSDTKQRAYGEVSAAARQLSKYGVAVHLFDDEHQATPDSVFPNNWFSTHADGQLIIYPMFAQNRRLEYRQDIIALLQTQYQVSEVIDYSGLVQQELFLEGTGSLVIDHHQRLAFAAVSKRTSPALVTRVCRQLQLTPVIFNAYDQQGVAVYHTNVMMCVASHFVLICLQMVPEPQRTELLACFKRSGHQVIDLSYQQIQHYCANAIELTGKDGPLLVLSETASNALSAEQRQIMEQTVTLLPIKVPTIESAGGSVRCMIAGIHLPKR
ncbi:MAG: amidinotransferase [Alkalimonas sp.]|nr:amidinotransferase [Alkalimonas sp.]